MRWAFEHMQAEDGGSVYLRLTTPDPSPQVERQDDAWREDALRGAYWPKPPAATAEAAIAFCGAVAPEVLEAAEQLADDIEGLGILNVISPGLLHRDWMAAQRGRWTEGAPRRSHRGEAALRSRPQRRPGDGYRRFAQRVVVVGRRAGPPGFCCWPGLRSDKWAT